MCNRTQCCESWRGTALSDGRWSLRAALVIVAVALLATQWVSAQRCAGNPNVGCTNSGAVCSPVFSGVGPTGHCVSPPGFPKGERECSCVGTPRVDLTGIWGADNGAVFYLRQIGNDVWWAGFNPDAFSTVASISNSFQRGLTNAQVFHGSIAGDALSGDWAEVPRQSTSDLSQGTVTVALLRNASGAVVQLQTQTQTGGFAPKSWSRSSIPALPCTNGAGKRDLYCLFGKVLKNQTETFWGSHESLLDNLKPYKDNVVLFGTVAGTYELGLSKGSALNCHDFFAYHDQDGDLNLDIIADRQNLNAQPGFWTNGWINSAADVEGKLNAWQNAVHTEIIMFGRQSTQCGAGNAVFLPGWGESGANSALANGAPVNAGITVSPVTIQGDPYPLTVGSRVRITGPLVLDCGHGIGSPCHETDNDLNDLDTKNLEIHPVYSVDVLQDFTQPRSATLDLTGSWAATDVGTYYVRQIGNTIWWLGLSSDQGLTFANVFQGTLQGHPIIVPPVANTAGKASARASKRAVVVRPAPAWPLAINGSWASLPLGGTQGNGDLSLNGTFCKNLNDNTVPCDPTQPAAAWNLLVSQSSSSPQFANPPNDRFQWQKLFDRSVNATPVIVVSPFLSITVKGNVTEAKGTIAVSNLGTAPLVIQSVSSNKPGFEFTPAALTIAPGAVGSIAWTWEIVPGAKTFDAVFSVASNDPKTPKATVSVEITVKGPKNNP